jgi:hypothetical protein
MVATVFMTSPPGGELINSPLRGGSIPLGQGTVNRSLIQTALGEVKDGRWRTLGEYLKFAEDQKYQRRDYGKINLWKVA